jgi:hypothetical protein
MKAKLQCNECGGIYFKGDADEAGYFHACPPEIVTTRAVDDGTGKITKQEVRAPRPNARDENIVIDALGKPKTRFDGAGATQL